MVQSPIHKLTIDRLKKVPYVRVLKRLACAGEGGGGGGGGFFRRMKSPLNMIGSIYIKLLG